jgi:hypothetical protein
MIQGPPFENEIFFLVKFLDDRGEDGCRIIVKGIVNSKINDLEFLRNNEGMPSAVICNSWLSIP